MTQAVALSEEKEKIEKDTNKNPAQNEIPQADINDEPIGYILRGERMTMGLSVEDVHQKLKIRPEIIEALEDNDLKSIGRAQFVSGYIRSYARLLNLNPEQVLDAYSKQCGLQRNNSQQNYKRVTDTSSASVLKLGNRKRSFGDRISDVTRTTSLAFPILTAFILLGGAVYVAANFVGGFQTLEVVPTETRPAALTGNDMPELTQNNAIETDAQIPAINYDEIFERQALQTPVVTPRAGRIADVDVNTVGIYATQSNNGQQNNTPNLLSNAQQGVEPTAPEIAQPGATPQIATADTANFGIAENGPVVTVGPTIPTIQLLPMDESWVSLTNEEGDVLFEKQLNPGEVANVPIDGYVPVLRRAGNATKLYVRIDGQVFGPVGADGASVVNNIPLTPNAIADAYELVADDLNLELKQIEQAYLTEAEQ